MSLTTHEIAAPPLELTISAEQYARQLPEDEVRRAAGLFILMTDSREAPRLLSSGAVMYRGAEVYAEGKLLEGSTVDLPTNERGLQTLWYGSPDNKAKGSATLVIPPQITVTGTWVALNNRRRIAGFGSLPSLGRAPSVASLAIALRNQSVDGTKIGLVVGETHPKGLRAEQKTLVDVRTGKVSRMLIEREELVARG